MIEGAPGHGEGHNSGQAVNITAAIAREEDHGAREAAGHDPHLAGHRRGAGRHQGVLRARRASSRTSTSRSSRTSATTSACRGAIATAPGLVSVEYTFTGQTAHSAGAPWRGRSALDAVELMNIGWNYRREHLPLEHRSHYVVTNGGDQPNVVPRNAVGLVLLPPDDVSEDQGAVGDRRIDRQGRRDDDRHRAPADARARERLAAALQQGRRRDDVRQHPEGRDAGVERGRPDARQGAAEGARQQRSRGSRSRSAPSCRARSATIAAAARTTSATSRGTCRR